MLADGYTVDGAATVLCWHKRRVTARRRILELPETAQTLVGSAEIPVAGIDALLEIQAVSSKLAALVADVIAEAAAQGNQLGAQLAGGTLYEDQIAELRQLRGPCAFDLCCDPTGRSRSAPVARDAAQPTAS